jgi:hypothetical protein
LAGSINAVQGEHRLGRVDANARDLGHERLLSLVDDTPSLARDTVGPSNPTVINSKTEK